LQQLADGSLYARLEQLGGSLEQSLRDIPGLWIQRCASIFWLILSRAGTPSLPIRSLAGVPADAGRCYSKLYHPLLDRGIYLAPSAFEVGFLSAAHDSDSVGQLAAGLRDLMRDL
jgi:glutamate-1-semialdehyde 2,1-aminomutase